MIPANPESRLGDGTLEERQMLAFSEFFLRHQVEHILYPEHRERTIILSDIDFATDMRTSDPTFYRMLRGVLANEMNGLKGGRIPRLARRRRKEASPRPRRG